MKIVVSVFVAIALFLGWYIWYKDFYIWSSDWTSIDYYVTNKSWNTNREKKIVFRKWDELEFFFIIKNKDKFFKKISFFVEDLLRQINLKDYKVEEYSEYVSGDSAQIIKVTWIADTNWIIPQDFKVPIDIIDSKDMQSSSSSSSQISWEKLIYTWTIDLKFDNNSIVSDIDNIIRVSWKWIDWVQKIWIWEKMFPLIKDKSWSSYIFIPAKTFESWNYFSFVVLNNSKISSLDSIFSVSLKNQKVIVLNVFPPNIKNDISRWVTVQWKWFKHILWVQLSNNTVFEKTDFKLVSDSVVAVKIPSWLSAWNYYINIMTIDWIFEFKEKNIKIEN